MITPAAVDEALDWADDPKTRCDDESKLRILAAEVRRLQGSEKMARIAQHELQDEVDRCNEELARLRQPVSDAEVSALEGRAQAWLAGNEGYKRIVGARDGYEIIRDLLDALLRRRTAGAGTFGIIDPDYSHD